MQSNPRHWKQSNLSLHKSGTEDRITSATRREEKPWAPPLRLSRWHTRVACEGHCEEEWQQLGTCKLRKSHKREGDNEHVLLRQPRQCVKVAHEGATGKGWQESQTAWRQWHRREIGELVKALRRNYEGVATQWGTDCNELVTNHWAGLTHSNLSIYLYNILRTSLHVKADTQEQSFIYRQ
jgi:hypothetical protein